MENQKNFIAFMGLSAVILILWSVFVSGPQMEQEKVRREQLQTLSEEQGTEDIPEVSASTDTPTASAAATEEIVAAPILSARIAIEADKVSGSIALQGARIDDLVLKTYRESTDPTSPQVTLLSPVGLEGAYFADFGWAPESGSSVKVPNKNSVWTQKGAGSLTSATAVEIFWDNGEGIIFRRTISVDDNFMFSITQTIENNSGTSVRLFPYGRISRHGEPETTGFYILHEGFLGVLNGTLEEVNYGDARDDGPFNYNTTGGWLGFTDKYWLAALVPDQNAEVNSSFSDRLSNGSDRFRSQYVYAQGYDVKPGGRSAVTNHFFAGAKENSLLASYGQEMSIPMFDYAIDWGIFRFFTRPLFKILDFFGGLVGNFGIAILITTVLVKLAFFPLANKQYRSMGQMKKIQPEMLKLRERYADDKAKQQQELMALYKREQVNPMAGCLPIVLQIPVFFAIYKVLFVTIEMRQAPFFGWIQDLAAQDPTTVFNLFGLLPYDPSGIPLIGTTLALGVWPLIMGFTMFLQMRMNPAPQDPIQEKMFMLMPIVFTFLLARFPAGLVIYWAWNNTLSILQQYVMMRRSGVEVELAKNIGLDRLMARFGSKRAESKDSGKTD